MAEAGSELFSLQFYAVGHTLSARSLELTVYLRLQ